MDRRSFLGGMALGALGSPFAVCAQQPVGVRRVAFLREGAGSNAPLVQALRGLGWIEGENIRFEPRFADDPGQLPVLAADLVRQQIDLIITVGTGPTRAAKQATADIPIVFNVGGDPVQRGLVASLAGPGGNLTGFVLGLYDDKQLQVLKAAVPGTTRVAYPVLAGANPPSLDSAKPLGVQLQGITVRNPGDFAPFFAVAKETGADAALIPDDRLVTHLNRIGKEASQSRLPSIGFQRIFAESGGLLSYAPMLSEARARLAVQVDRILRGANPADLPVEQPTRFELVINMKEAKALRLSIPQLVRLGADELIL
jgi:putative ABC transport system substrate-binding protein